MKVTIYEKYSWSQRARRSQVAFKNLGPPPLQSSHWKLPLDQGDALLSPQWQDEEVRKREDFSSLDQGDALPEKDESEEEDVDSDVASNIEEEEKFGDGEKEEDKLIPKEEEKSRDWADQVEEEESKDIDSDVDRDSEEEERSQKGATKKLAEEKVEDMLKVMEGWRSEYLKKGMEEWQEIKPRTVQTVKA